MNPISLKSRKKKRRKPMLPMPWPQRLINPRSSMVIPIYIQPSNVQSCLKIFKSFSSCAFCSDTTSLQGYMNSQKTELALSYQSCKVSKSAWSERKDCISALGTRRTQQTLNNKTERQARFRGTEWWEVGKSDKDLLFTDCNKIIKQSFSHKSWVGINYVQYLR